MIIRLPIDIKSLYLNIKNDNESGHTATVATPLKQYGGVNEQLVKILDVPENVNPISKEGMISQILSKSRAEAKINNVFVFDKISVNGIRIENIPSYCIYIREETAEGYVHCGRQKVHYPITFKYSDEEVEINNKAVMNAIAEQLSNYAFIVEAFEYDTESKVLNFDVIVVGTKDIPYSKVFINRRGVGGKFTSNFSEESESYDAEIIALRERYGYSNVGPENFTSVMQDNRMIAENIAEEYLKEAGATEIRKLREEYPYALYDIEYKVNGVKRYMLVRFTATNSKYFNLSFNKIKFCNDFNGQVCVCLITDINGKAKTNIYTIEDMNRMNKRLNSICYEDTEE